MYIVNSGTNNTISYYTRYETINYYEILDHWSRIVYSGNTIISAISGQIEHTGITYNFKPNNLYTYKSYYINNNEKLLANQTLIQSYLDDTMISDNFKWQETSRRQFSSGEKLENHYVEDDYVVNDYVE